MGGDGEQRADHRHPDGYRPQSGLPDPDERQALTEPVLLASEASGHRGVQRVDASEQQEQQQRVLEADQRQRSDGPILAEGVQADPDVGCGHPQRGEIPALTMQGQPMQQQRGDDDARGDSEFAVDGAGARADRQQHQRRLRGDRVVVVVVGDEHVQHDQCQQQQSECGGIDREDAPQLPVVEVDRQPVEQFHRDDHPGDSEDVHARIGDPTLPQPEAEQGESQQREHPDQRGDSVVGPKDESDR